MPGPFLSTGPFKVFRAMDVETFSWKMCPDFEDDCLQV